MRESSASADLAGVPMCKDKWEEGSAREQGLMNLLLCFAQGDGCPSSDAGSIAYTDSKTTFEFALHNVK
jgi:hypothetical protein